MAAHSKEFKIKLDDVTIERHARLYNWGDFTLIAQRANIPTNNGILGYYMKSRIAPKTIALAIKEFYEEKEALETALLTPKI